MDAATNLFDTLRAFRTHPASGKSPHQSVIEYCNNNLGGIEQVHFDFKEKRDPLRPALDDDDKKNLAKAISGFANGSGGVLIWGIQDTSMSPRPISQVSKFIDGILQMAHQATDPPVPGIDGDFVPSDANPDDGFGFILVPESQLPPHRVVLRLPKVQNHYYTRTGSSFVIAGTPNSKTCSAGDHAPSWFSSTRPVQACIPARQTYNYQFETSAVDLRRIRS